MTPSLSKHLAEHSILTKAEEAKLAVIIHNNKKGKQEAINKLVLHNLKLASKIANEQVYFQDKEDLFIEAVIGLQQAAARFKPGFDAKFSTYAAFTIRSRIKRYIGEFSNQVTPSQGAMKELALFKRFIDLYEQEYGETPTTEQISEILGIDEERVEEMLQHQFHFTSLNVSEQYGDESSRLSLADSLADPNAVMPYANAELSNVHDCIFESLNTLNDREKNIISERFGFVDGTPKTLESIGEGYGISRERIRQIQDIAFKKLRKKLKSLSDCQLNYSNN